LIATPLHTDVWVDGNQMPSFTLKVMLKILRTNMCTLPRPKFVKKHNIPDKLMFKPTTLFQPTLLLNLKLLLLNNQFQ
jgi:hypothetical protein